MLRFVCVLFFVYMTFELRHDNPIYNSTWSDIPEQFNLLQNRCENLSEPICGPFPSAQIRSTLCALT